VVPLICFDFICFVSHWRNHWNGLRRTELAAFLAELWAWAVTQFMVRKLVTYMLLTAACMHLLATADEPRALGESGLGDGAGDELVWQLCSNPNPDPSPDPNPDPNPSPSPDLNPDPDQVWQLLAVANFTQAIVSR